MAATLLLAVTLLASPLQAATTRVSCHDPDGVAGKAGEWYARYSVTDDGRFARFEELGFVPYEGWNILYAVPQSASWQVTLRPVEPAPLDIRQATTRELLTGTAARRLRDLELYPQLLTPNRHCTIYLRTYDYLAPSYFRPTGARVAVVGDSLTQAFTYEQKTRRALAQEFAWRNWHMEVSAIGGLAWMLAPGMAVGGNLRDEIRGLLTTRPDVFVFELGTNDALHITKTRMEKTGITTEQARRDAVTHIAQTLEEVEAYAPAMCKVLITPSTHPYFMVTQYTDEAIFIGDVLRFFAGNPTKSDIRDYVKGLKPISNVRLVDWAAISADKRISEHMPDGIHMDEQASSVFRLSWMREIAACKNLAGAVIPGRDAR